DRPILTLVDDAGRLHPPHPLVERLRGEEVLLGLALGPSEAGLLVGQPPEALGLGRPRLGHRRDDAVGGVLVERFVAVLGGGGGAEEVAGLLDRAEVGVHGRGLRGSQSSARLPRKANDRSALTSPTWRR